MNARFKFRVWNGSSMMSHSKNLDISIFAIKRELQDKGLLVLPISDYQIMQGVGVNDGNNVELYESDIIYYETEDIFGVVEMDESCFSLCIRWVNYSQTQTHFVNISDKQKIFVRGNIYENKDLLI